MRGTKNRGAFANTKGGSVLIGVSDKGKIKGITVGRTTLRDWSNQISQSTEPRLIPEIEDLKIEEKEIVVIQIKEYPIKQIKAVMYVKEKSKITNKEYQEICKTSERTATRDLSNLVSSGLLEQVGITGKGTGYVLRRHKDATKTPKGLRTGL